jgi:hypothetical protein
MKVGQRRSLASKPSNYNKGGLALMAAPGLVVGLLFFVLPLLAVLREAYTGGRAEFF